MQTIKLKNDFKIGGVTITELSYDVQNFTGDDYLAAADEMDGLKPLRGVDVVRFAAIGNDFFSQAAEEQPADNSVAPTASTPSDSTPPSES